MQINMNAPSAIEAKRCATIMDKTILLDKGVCIPDPNRFMWIKTK
jgi:hypothetical protein